MFKNLDMAKKRLETSIHFMEVLKIDNSLVKLNVMDALLYIEAELRLQEGKSTSMADALEKARNNKENLHNIR